MVMELLLGRKRCWKQQRQKEAGCSPSFCLGCVRGSYLASVGSPALASVGSPGFLRLSQLYFFWNFSTRPVVSTNFILPVKNGWQAEQISTVMFLRVLPVVNLLPHPQVTVVSLYSGWMPFFMTRLPHCS